MKGISMKNPGFTRCGVVTLTAAIATSLLGQTANAQGLLWPLFHPFGSYTYTSSAVSFAPSSNNLMLVPIQGAQTASVGSTSVNGLNLVPISNVQAAGVTAGQTFQLVQTPTNLVSVASVGSSPSYYIVRGAQAQSNLVAMPAGGQTSAVAAAGVGSLDSDYAVLSAGFGNRFSKISELEQFLQGKLAGLLNGSGKDLGSSDLTSILMDAAKTFLSQNQFGFLFTEVEPIIERLIGRLLQKNARPPPPVKPTPYQQPGNINGKPTSGSQTFTITGTVTLGPSTGQTQDQHPKQSTTFPDNLPSPDNAQPAKPPAN